jgi:hypothetical protein
MFGLLSLSLDSIHITKQLSKFFCSITNWKFVSVPLFQDEPTDLYISKFQLTVNALIFTLFIYEVEVSQYLDSSHMRSCFVNDTLSAILDQIFEQN